jgi:MoaA/NifB/PqqE/SkfB family radical SAM enzyme
MIGTRSIPMAAHFLKYRLRKVHPFEVQALLTDSCDLKCAYCACPKRGTSAMSTVEWRMTIRGLAARGMMRIKFQGGEPTVRPDFPALSEEAQRQGVITAVITNGQGIAGNPSLLDHLDEIVVSLDSPTPQVHDKLRGAGTHARAVAALDLARSRGIRPYVVLVASRANVALIEPMLDFCESRGVRLHVQPAIFGRDAFDDGARPLGLDAGQMRDLHRALGAWKRRGRGLMFSAGAYEGGARWPDYSTLTKASSGQSGCMAGKYYFHIEANGDVWPCAQHGARLTPKNVIRDGLDAALQNAGRHNCGDCFTTYLNERKSVFSLKPRALLEIVRRG